MNRIGRFLSQKALFITVLLVILGAWPLSHLPRIKVDNSIDVWLDHQTREYQEFREFTRDYGNNEWLLIAFSVQAIPWEKARADLKEISGQIREIAEGIHAVSIANTENPAAALLRPILISEDRKTVGILVHFPEAVQVDRSTLLDRIDSILDSHQSSYSFHLGGPAFLNVELDRASKYQMRFLLTLAFVISAIGLYWIFRSIVYVLVAIIASGLSVLWTLGIATGFGMTMNMITTVLPILLWVYTVSGGIHVIYQIRQRWKDGTSLDEAVAEAIGMIFFPYTIAYLTTAIGFLSLSSSHMKPVRDLGGYAGLGIGLGFLGNLILIPGILKLFRKVEVKGFTPRPHPSDVLHWAIARIRKWRGVIALSGILILFLSILLLPLVKIESNVLAFFKPGSRILTDYRFVSDNLTGLSTVELDFQGPLGDCYTYAQQLTEALKDIPEIKPVVYPAGSNLRMTIIVKTMESMTFNKLVSDIQLRMNQIPSSGVTTRLTGTVVLINQVQEKLLHSQIASFGLAFIVIFVIFVFIFRSLPLVMVGVIVNLFPIAIFLWAMVLFRIPLNVATVMIASIAIGIAVDDTAYFFRQFKAEFARCSCWDASIEQAYLVWGRPMTFTSLVTTLGFTILILASFKPISLFGLLGTVTLTAAWAGDVILSPALLYLMPQSLRKV